MTASLVVLGVVCLALTVALVLIVRGHTRLVYDLEERHAAERAELTTRIQHPGFVPPVRPRAAPSLGEDGEDPPKPDQRHKVGTVAPLRPVPDAEAGADGDGSA